MGSADPAEPVPVSGPPVEAPDDRDAVQSPCAVQRWFQATPASVSAARAWARQQLATRLDAQRLDVFLLLLSEVVTNAVRHTLGPRVRVELAANGVAAASVYDDSAGEPTPRRAAEDEDNGRGLALVECLADRWGTDRHPTGNRVWFQLALV